MEKNLVKSVFEILLPTIVFGIIICNSHVYATDFEEINLEKIISTDEKIMKYDSKTGETTEVDMEDLREKLKLKNNGVVPNKVSAKSTQKSIFRSESIQPRAASATPINNAALYPYKATCRLTYTKANGQEGHASGALVGKKILLTAAHCVFDQTSKAQHENWKAYPGYPDLRMQGKAVYAGWSQVYYSSTWMNHSAIDLDHDWAICILEQNLGEMIGAWYGAQFFENTAVLIDKDIKMLGYPCDSDYMFYDGTKQYESRAIINSATNTCIYPRELFNSDGFSGSPITEVGDNYILSIYVGTHGLAKIPTGVRITQEMGNIINSIEQ